MSHLIKGLQFLKERRVTELKGVDLEPWYEIEAKLREVNYTKDEVHQAYLAGFTSGELLPNNPHYNTRQALYANLDRIAPNNSYREINKKNRDLVLSLVKYYKAYVIVELTGDLTYAEEEFKNNRSQMILYYLDNGGTRDIWQEGSHTQTKYAPYFKYMDQGCAIEHVISGLQEQGVQTDEEQQLVNLTSKELNSLKAAYGRNKKQKVLELILTGVTEQEILERYHMSAKQYKKHYKNVAGEVKKCYNSLSNKDNHVQKIKYLLKVVGDATDTITEILATA